MDEHLMTFGLLMGMEVENKQNTGAGDCGSDVLLIFCPTYESDEGKIEVTPRMKDLALMGFQPVAITRWNPEDTRNYVIFSKEGISDCMRNAVLNDTWSLLRDALLGSEFWNYSSTNSNN
jgi:hypothetical protein